VVKNILMRMSRDDQHVDFGNLEPSAAMDYVRAVLARKIELSAKDLSDLERDLDLFDELHTACAIKLLGKFAPRALLPRLARLLLDRRPGVHCAASRAIVNDIPPDLMTAVVCQEFSERWFEMKDDFVIKLPFDFLSKLSG